MTRCEQSCPRASSVRSPLYSEYLDDEWASLETYGVGRSGISARTSTADATSASSSPTRCPRFEFATKFRDRIFPGVPVVHIAVARDRLDRLTLPAGRRRQFRGPRPDADAAARAAPAPGRQTPRRHTRRGRAGSGCGTSECERRWDSSGSGLSVEYLAGLPTAEVLRRVGALSKDTIVFTPGYFVDGAGEVSTPRQSVERIAGASAVPVYGAFDTLLGRRHRRRLHDALRGAGERGRRDRRSPLERHGANGYRFFVGHPDPDGRLAATAPLGHRRAPAASRYDRPVSRADRVGQRTGARSPSESRSWCFRPG